MCVLPLETEEVASFPYGEKRKSKGKRETRKGSGREKNERERLQILKSNRSSGDY